MNWCSSSCSRNRRSETGGCAAPRRAAPRALAFRRALRRSLVRADPAAAPLDPYHSHDTHSPRGGTQTQTHMRAEAAPIFRVQSRELLAGGLCADSLEEQVNFVAPMRVLFWKAWARTCVTQRADFSRRDSEVTVDFGLVHSDLMAKLEGSWRFTLLRTPGACAGAGPMAADDPRWPLCRVQYTFSMWPKGERPPPLLHCVSF
jgi:hypothetical protein